MTQTAPTNRCSSTIVVPCYNEAHRFRTDRFFEFLAVNHSVRFLFVNDGSTDGTLSMLEAMQQNAAQQGHKDRIAILDKQQNAGKAEAIRDGMNAALIASHHDPAYGCESIGFWDADLATPLAAIPQLLHHLETTPQLQMVFGSRVRLLGRTIHRNPARHYLGRLFATVASLTLSLPIYDTQCGAKIFKVTPDLTHVLAQPFLSRWIFDVEIVARFIQLRGRDFCFHSIYEFPLHSWQDIGGSKLRSHDFLYAIVDMFHIHRHYLANRSGPST